VYSVTTTSLAFALALGLFRPGCRHSPLSSSYYYHFIL
jgi:hypothetical protein